MTNEIERKIAALGPPGTDEERIFRIAWPYHPAYYGIRIIETEGELIEAIGAQTPKETLDSMRRLVGEGMRVLILEAVPSDHRTFQRILASSLGTATPEGRS